jgi:hypothetical protein
MDGWVWALLLKMLIGIGIAGAYYVLVIKGLSWIYPRLPKSRFVDFLFVERGDRKPDYGPSESVHKRQRQRAQTERTRLPKLD